MRTTIFTTGVLFKNGRVLILKRREDEDISPGKWDSIGGHLHLNESGEECMLREAKEETGLDVEIVQAGKSFEIFVKDRRFIVLPYLLSAKSDAVKITEHVDFKWVSPIELREYDCVPDLMEAAKMFGLIK